MANMSTVPDCVQYGYTPPLAGEAGPSNWLEELMRRKTTSAVSDVDCMERDSNPSVDEADRLPGFGTCTRRKTPASLTEYMFDDDAGKATSDADDDGRMGKGSSIAVHGAETRKLRVKSRSRSREDEWALTEDHQCSSASAKSDEDYDRKKPAERAKAKPKTGLSARFYRGYDRWKELSREARDGERDVMARILAKFSWAKASRGSRKSLQEPVSPKSRVDPASLQGQKPPKGSCHR